MIDLQLPDSSQKRFSSLFVKPMFDFPQRLLIIIFSLMILSLSQSAFLLLLGPFFKSLFTLGSLEALTLSELLPENISRSLPSLGNISISKEQVTWMIPSGLFVAVLAKGVAGYFFQYNQQGLALHVAKRYRDRLFGAILNRPYLKIHERSPGEWMSVLMNDVLYLQSRYSDFLSSVIKDSVLIISALGAMVIIHWETAVTLFVCAPFLFIILGKTSKRISHFAEGWQKDLSKMSGLVLSLRKRYPFIQGQHSQAYESKLFSGYNEKYLETVKKSILLRAIFSPGLELAGFLGFSIVLLLISKGFFGEGFGPEKLIQFLAALGVLLRPLKSLGEQVARLQETKGALQEGYKIFDPIPEEGAIKWTNDPLTREELFIKDVSAGYNDKVCIKGSKLSLKLGKSIAIVGPSGSGKSTLVRTLVGLQPPLHWQGDMDWKKFIEQTSFVSQKPFMFEDSIRTNLLYGLDHKKNDEVIWEALKHVAMEDAVRSLPSGLESTVSAVRSNFSGGQVQRLVIARSLLRNKPFLVFDEATSAIDLENEELITRHLLMQVSTQKVGLLFVTHRLVKLYDFDEVWFVENGKISLIGSHNELLKHQRYNEFIKVTSE